jgi:hypothetical protein
MRLRTLAVAAGLLWPASVFCQGGPAFYISGNQLYEDCSVNNSFCFGYVAGTADAFSKDRTACVEKGVTVRQAVDIVMNYLRENPKYLQVSASLLAGTALGQAFPCKQ